jgi:hypothetical protein
MAGPTPAAPAADEVVRSPREPGLTILQMGKAMLKQVWNDYRGWAKRARDLQAATGWWNLAALAFVVIAAICGAATTLFPDSHGSPNAWGASLAFAAAVAAVIGAFVGRQIVGAGTEDNWIQARATAEGIKSECFRFAAEAGVYSGPAAEAAKTFDQRTGEIAKQATDKQLVPADDPIPASGDKREPPVSMDKVWYRQNRIAEQIDYYRKGRAKNEAIAGCLWWVAFLSALAAVVLGALGASIAPHVAPWIGAATTVAASIAAYGLLDRRKYLIASSAAMKSSLEHILARDEQIPMSLGDLVTTTEDLLEGEHKAWLPQMLSTKHAARPDAPTPPKPGA